MVPFREKRYIPYWTEKKNRILAFQDIGNIPVGRNKPNRQFFN